MGLYLRYHEGEKAVSQVGTILRSAFNVLPLVVIFIFIRNIISILVSNSLLTVNGPRVLQKSRGDRTEYWN
jgi:hypothetical protein